jgi:protein-tyrosine phosphatase
MASRDRLLVVLDAHHRLFYPHYFMSNFYNPFAAPPMESRGRRPEVSEILPQLFVGEYPRIEDVAWLKQTFGISAVFSLQDDEDLTAKGLSLPDLTQEYRLYQIEFRRTPVADFNCESLARALPSALHILHELAQQSHILFLHCNAGCNRAPTMAIAYLHRHRQMGLAEARDFVKERRPCGPYMDILYQYFGRPGL